MSLILIVDDNPTLVRVIEIALARAGYEAISAGDGEEGLAVARARLPDLILVDFIMPKLNGYQFCRELAVDDQLRQTPVILMSGRGDQVGARFVRTMGIVDYVAKPFAPEALVATIAAALEKYQRPQESHTQPVLPSEDPSAQARAHEQAVGVVQAQLEEVLSAKYLIPEDTGTGTGEAAVPPRTTAPATLTAAASDIVYADSAVKDLLATLPLTAQNAAMIVDLEKFALSDLLSLMASQGQTGVIEILQRGQAAPTTISIFLERGWVQSAIARGVREEFVLGRFLVQAGLIEQATLEAHVAALAPEHGRLGESLVAKGLVKEVDVRACLARQTSELIYEALRFSRGELRFRPLPAIEVTARGANLRLDIEGLLMEGYRRVDEWHLIEQTIDDFDAVFVKNDEAVGRMGSGRLSREEQTTLDLIDGRHTVRDIIAKTNLVAFSAARLLTRLAALRLIRRRIRPIAVT